MSREIRDQVILDMLGVNHRLQEIVEDAAGNARDELNRVIAVDSPWWQRIVGR